MRSFSAIIAALALLLAGCSDNAFFGENEEPPLPGKRIPILESGRTITPQEQIAGTPVTVPEAMARGDWPQVAGNPAHYGGNLAFFASPAEIWQASTAKGAVDEARRPLAPPVAANGRVFVLDAVLNVRAYDAATGAEVWAVGTAAPGEHDGFGGGLATDGERVYIVGGHGQALALEASTGRLYWRTALPGPVRGAPALADGDLYVATADNRLLGIRADDGAIQWNVPGGVAGAGLLGAATPAVGRGAVIAALDTGEILAVRAANGREIWRNSLAALRRFDFGAKLSDIAGSPVLYENAVYAASAAGRAAAFSLRTGNQLWERRLGSSQTLWLAGDWIFALTTESELVALERRRGFVRWVFPLERYEDPEDQDGAYFYSGPVLAGGRLITVRSDGQIAFHSIEDGSPVTTIETGDDTILPPIVADGVLYLLADNGTLRAFR